MYFRRQKSYNKQISSRASSVRNQSPNTAAHHRALHGASLALASFVCLWVLFVAFAEPLRVSAATDTESAIVSVTVNAAISLTCDDLLVLDSITDFGTSDGTISCNVRTNNKDGYDLTWQVTTGSGGTNTGAMISEHEDVIPGFFASKEGLVGHWRLDELNAGDTVLDSSGNGNHGTPQGTGGANNRPQPSTDLPGVGNFRNVRSLDFDGEDDYVSLGNVPQLGFSDPGAIFSVGIWYRLPVEQTSVFVGKQTTAGVTSGWSLAWNANLGLRFSLRRNNTATGVVGNAAWAYSSEWQHAVAVFDGPTASSDRLKLYANGQRLALSYEQNNTSAAGANSIPIRFAARDDGDGNPTEFARAHFDDIRIYNRALSAAEIKSLYVQTQPWSIDAAEGYWGARLKSSSTDMDAKWGTDGSSEKWLNVGDGSYTVVSRLSETMHEGSDQVFDFRVQIGADKIQPTGTYQATVELIASAR